MRKVSITFTALVLVVALAPMSASAAEPHLGCSSGWMLLPIVGSSGDPAPPPGVDPIWDLRVAGIFAEGYESLEEFVELVGGPEFGVGSVDEFYSLVSVAISERFDLNADRLVCLKPTPPKHPNVPAYIFKIRDNTFQG